MRRHPATRAARRVRRTAAALLAATAAAGAAPRGAGAQDGAPPDTAAGAAARTRPARCERPGHRRAVQTAAGAVFVGGNLALYEYFRRAWWSGERADFHVNWEENTWYRQSDKFGHGYGGYFLTVGGRELLRAACVSEKKAALWGAAYAAAFQLQIELWDGTQAQYGFSPTDLMANTAGAGFALAQTFSPRLRAITPTISYHRTRALRNVDRFPPGAQGGDLRPTVDYSGQTYWFSADMDSLLPRRARRYWPGLLRLSAGHSITDWVNPNSGQFQVARHVFVLSLDVDPNKLPGNGPVWRTVKKGLSYYHFPAPALVLTPSFKVHKWYR